MKADELLISFHFYFINTEIFVKTTKLDLVHFFLISLVYIWLWYQMSRLITQFMTKFKGHHGQKTNQMNAKKVSLVINYIIIQTHSCLDQSRLRILDKTPPSINK